MALSEILRLIGLSYLVVACTNLAVAVMFLAPAWATGFVRSRDALRNYLLVGLVAGAIVIPLTGLIYAIFAWLLPFVKWMAEAEAEMAKWERENPELADRLHMHRQSPPGFW